MSDSLWRRINQLQQTLSQFQSNLSRALSRETTRVQQEHERRVAQRQRQNQEEMNRLEAQQQAFEANLALEMARMKHEQAWNRQRVRMQHVRSHMKQWIRQLKQSCSITSSALATLEDSARQLEGSYIQLCSELQTLENEVKRLETQLETELEHRDKFEMDEERKTSKIVLIGNTGDGKSTLGNRLLGDTSRRGNEIKFATSASTGSVTNTIDCGFVMRNDVAMTIVDTPGLGDTNGEDRIHANRLVKFLYGIENVQSFILVRNGTNCRLNEQDVRALRQLTRVLGKEFRSHVVVVMTFLDDEDDEQDMMERKDDFLCHVGRLFRLDDGVWRNMPFVCIGKRSFPVRVEEIFLRAESFGTPFVCHALRAPVEDLKEQLNRTCIKRNEKAVQRGTCELRLANTRDEINVMQTRLGDLKIQVTEPHCYCRDPLVAVSAGGAYASSGVICDNCEKQVPPTENVLHCSRGKVSVHPWGYDLCRDCAASYGNP